MDRTTDTGTNCQAETEQPSQRRDSLRNPVQETLKGQVSVGRWGTRMKTTPSQVRWCRNSEGRIFLLMKEDVTSL